MRLLVVNVGSSSLKLSVLEGLTLVASEDLRLEGGRLDEAAVREALERHGPVDAVGHRIVHGGSEFTDAVLVDEVVRRRLEALVDLAPLHLPKSLAGLDLVGRLLPGVPAVACFDTAFHATIGPAAATYALPAEWRRRWSLRRFGFHGLSHSWAAKRAGELTGRPAGALRIVSCHLGAGASLAAIAGGVSVDTTMGFTPLEGLVMATRSGSVDPGLVLWLEQHVGLPPAELASTLEHRSGLLGLTGSGDMQAVLEAEASGDELAGLGIAVYLHRLAASVAAMAAATGGLDVLVFTGGVGEHAASIRRRAAERLGFLGVSIDAAANETATPDAEITAARAAVRVLVVEAREDLQIAGEVERLLARDG
ncbi:MAG TPA: acetate/propionate family kinase [Acidimicrobiales bacterium]|nr:acetate/propionate family kinase [Acidimicrobiales bacterium]